LVCRNYYIFQYTGNLYANPHGTHRHGGVARHCLTSLSNRKAINSEPYWVRLLQVGIGALILYVPAGRKVLLAMSEGVAT
jgi:hypothetical protein